MKFYAKTYLALVPILILLDVFWLGFVMKDFNIRQLSNIVLMENGSIAPRMVPALLTYLVMALSITFFAAPKIKTGTWLSCLGVGALLGFCVYAVYDLTNLAVLKEYPVPFVLADIGWGIASYGIANTALFFLRAWLI